MPVYDNVMEKLVRGNDRDVTRDVTGIPSGTLITDAYLVVQDPSNLQLFQKHITTTLVSTEGVIEDAGAIDGIGRVRFRLTKTNTLLMTGGTNDAPVNHPYAIEVITSGGLTNEDEQGIIPVLEQRVIPT